MRFFSILTIALILIVASLASAQEITGTISGTITDPTGAVIPNATITVLNTDKNVVTRTLNTNSGGAYSAPLLPIGNYTVTVSHPGFRQMTTTGIKLNVNDRLTLNMKMEVGAAEATVNVEANPLQVELQSTTASGLITGTEVRELSLNSRNYEQLLILQPGVSYGGGDQLYFGVMNPNGDDNSVSFSINGARDNANNWTIDGADNVDRGSNSTLLNYPSVDSIAEFKVLRGMYDPEFGRAAGGQINVVTKSGESKFHGSVYEFFRNDALNATNYFNKHWAPAADNPWVKNPLRYNNFGGTFGGPLYIPGHYNVEKNKTFFFYSQEFRRVITSATSNPAVVPTANEKQGIFASPVCVMFDAEGNCAANGILPAGQPITSMVPINSVAQAYIDNMFSKIANPQDAVAHTLISPMRNVYNYRQEVIKVDHVFGPKLSIFGRWMHDSIPTEEPAGLWTDLNVPGVATTSTNAPGRNLMFRATATFSPTFLLDTGYAYSYGAIVSRNIGTAAIKNSPGIMNALNLPYASTGGRVPTINFDGGEPFTGFGNYDDFNTNHNWFGNLTKIIGKHTLKFGASFNKYNKNENAGGNNAGSYTFSYQGAPEGTMEFEQSWANFLTGNVSDFSQDSIDAVADTNQTTMEFYLQDQYRVTRNLMISYGVRYSLFRQPTDGNGKLTNFDPRLYDPNKAPLIDLEGNIAPDQYVCGQEPAGQRCYDPLNGIIIGGKNSPYGSGVSRQNNANFAPRLGIAWDPFGKGRTSIRAGYGIFYDASTVGYVEDNSWTNPPFVRSVTYYGNPAFGNPGSGQAVTNVVPALRIAGVDWHTPYTQQWSLDIQHQLPSDFLVDIGYYGNKGTHLLGGIDLNQVRPGVALAANLVPIEGVSTDALGPLNQVRPYLGYAQMNSVEPWFNSNYHSLQASLQKRFKGASMFGVAYTYSKGMTDSPGDRWNAPQSTYDIHANYGPSPLDRKHMLTASFVYEFPWMREQRGFAGHLLGGWQTSGIVTFSSGVPLTITSDSGMDKAGLGILASDWNSLLPDMSGNPNNGPKTVDQWFNTGVFSDVPDGEYRVGNERRGAVRGPGFQRWDMSLFKNIKMTERASLQFRAEAFNIWNHTNFRDVDTAMPVGWPTPAEGSTFGQVVSARDPRNIQFGLKLTF